MEIICYAIGCSLSILFCTASTIAIQREMELELEEERNNRSEEESFHYLISPI